MGFKRSLQAPGTVLSVALGSFGLFCLSVAFTIHAKTFDDASASVGAATTKTSSMISRLSERLARNGMRAANERDTVVSSQRRADLLSAIITLHFDVSGDEGAPLPDDVRLRVSDHPEWITANRETGLFSIDEMTIRRFFADEQESVLKKPVHAIAKDQRDAFGVARYTVIGDPAGGYVMNPALAASAVMRALRDGETTADIAVTYEAPRVFVITENGTTELRLLSRGRSDFEGSPLGRIANVQKAHDERLRGVLVPSGELFSFNQAIKGSTGWRDALVIVGGGKLAAEPGGGICQAATTAFRAAVLAGLPIEERANHSLYVTYYKAHGVGIDATVYAGKQDFSFRNDTNNPLMIVARTEGSEAFVELYGVPDGRTATLNGPFFANDATMSERGKTLRGNQIGWTYDVTHADGTVTSDTIVSTYKAIPKNLAAEYEGKTGMGELLGMYRTEKILSPMSIKELSMNVAR